MVQFVPSAPTVSAIPIGVPRQWDMEVLVSGIRRNLKPHRCLWVEGTRGIKVRVACFTGTHILLSRKRDPAQSWNLKPSKEGSQFLGKLTTLEKNGHLNFVELR